MTNIVVTGGAGYIGSHVCMALAERGYHPVVLDNLSTGNSWAVQWGPLEVISLHDQPRVTECLEKYRPAAVMHFAASAYVGESIIRPADYYRNNIAGTLSLLDACRAANVENIVFSSTCATYGLAPPGPITEETPQVPINPYGRSKLFVERILQDYSAAYGLKVTMLRYFNAAGADRALRIGEHHVPETHLIPLALDAAAGKGPALTILGDDYPTRDGTCIRDFIHVEDLATAHVLALQALLADGLAVALNLGNENGSSLLEVIESVERVTGRRVPTRLGPRRPGDPPELVADAGRARQLLGWHPAQPHLDQIVQTAAAWHAGFDDVALRSAAPNVRVAAS